MKIDFCKEPIIDLDGKEVVIPNTKEVMLIGKAIANIILSTKERTWDSFKLYELGKKFHKCEVVDMLDADIEIFRTILRNDESFGHIVKGQILERLK